MRLPLPTCICPTTLPLSLPSTLVRQRPDILAAEAQLRAANAQVGEAVARMYPNLQLSGSFGDQSNHLGSLFDPASRLWDLAANLVQPLFEGGTLAAQKHATEAAYRGGVCQLPEHGAGRIPQCGRRAARVTT